MRVRYHVLVSAGLSIGVQSVLHSWPATLGCFLGGTVIDIDHYLEYCLHRKRMTLRYQDLVDFCVPYRENKVYLIFHAFEYLIALWLMILLLHLGTLWLGIAVGLTVHLIMDQFSNPIRPLFYFLTYRFQKQFQTAKLLSEKNFSM